MPDEILRLAVYTSEQVAKLLSLNLQTVQRYLKQGKIRAVKVGNQYRIMGKALLAFMDRDEELGAHRRK